MRAHFEREDGDRFAQLDGDVLGHVHGECGFSHGRTRGDDDHFRAVQAIGHLVKIGEAGGEAGDLAAAVIQLVDLRDRLHELILEALGFVLVAVVGDFEDLGFHVVEERLDLVLIFVTARGVFRADADDFAEDEFFLNDLDVVGRVGRRRDEHEKPGDERRAAAVIEQVLIAQPLRERDDVDGNILIPHFHQLAVNRGVGRDVKVRGDDPFFRTQPADLARGQEDRCEDALLRIRRLWQ